MKWPLVTRKRFERLRRKKKEMRANLREQLAGVTKERDDLADRLRSLEQELVRAPKGETAAPQETTGPQRFTTPMDRLETRFTEALKDGKVPQSARARVH